MSEHPTVVAYLKPTCGWSQGVREVLQRYGLPYEEKNIIDHPEHYAEMVQKSGQPLSPCVEINGHMLADVGDDELEAWMLQQGVVQPVAA